MNNQEKIDLVSSIVNPYFNFNMNDMYGDRGGPIPKIEEIKYLFFKMDGTMYHSKRYLKLTKNDIENLIDRVNNLNIGIASLIKIDGIGRFIHIELKNDYHEMEI